MWRYVLILLTLVVGGCGSSRPSAQREITEVTSSISEAPLSREVPSARALDIDRFGAIYVLLNDRLLKLGPEGDSLKEVSGRGADHYQFDDAVDVDTRLPNTVLVTDRLNHRVEMYSRELTYVTTLYTRDDPDPNHRFGYPRAASGDKAGDVFVLDGEGQRVLKFRSDQTYERTFGGYGASSRPEATLSDPRSLITDDQDRVIVLDKGGQSLAVFDNFGTMISRNDLGALYSRLAVVDDTLFVLGSFLQGSDLRGFWKPSLRMFELPSLAEIGKCEAILLDREPVPDIAFRRANALWLNGQRIARLSFQAISR